MNLILFIQKYLKQRHPDNNPLEMMESVDYMLWSDNWTTGSFYSSIKIYNSIILTQSNVKDI